MGELRTQMERARREAQADDVALEQLEELRDRSRRKGRLLSAAVALAVTGAMVVGAIAVLGHRSGTGQAGDDGADDPSTAPAAGPNLVAAPGQFYYWKYVVVLSSGTATITHWHGVDGSGRVEASKTTNDYGIPPDERWGAGAAPWFAQEDLSGLSTDPETLLGQLLARGSPAGASPAPNVTPMAGQEPTTGGIVRTIEGLLDEFAPSSPPDLRVALYEVFRGLPTVEDLGATDDPAGRPAVALRIVTEGTERTLFFDPDTRLFMSEETRATDGTRSSFVVVEDGGIVDSLDERPSADTAFFPVAERLPQATGGLEPEATSKA